MNNGLKRDPEKKYMVEVSGDVFAVPPPKDYTFTKHVLGKDINVNRCPLCEGRGRGVLPDIYTTADGTQRIGKGGGFVQCPLCGGKGKFDYNKDASQIDPV